VSKGILVELVSATSHPLPAPSHTHFSEVFELPHPQMSVRVRNTTFSFRVWGMQRITPSFPFPFPTAIRLTRSASLAVKKNGLALSVVAASGRSTGLSPKVGFHIVKLAFTL